MNSDKIIIDSIRKGIADVKAEFKSIARIGINEAEHKERIADALRGFDPDIHVVVTKEQLDLTKQLQALTALNTIVDNVQQVKAEQRHIASKIDELHAVQTGSLYKHKEKPSKKELEEARIQKLMNTGLRNILNGKN